ncbi:MAG: tripartite tricarboxylate transporter TctB family protein [Marinosulfonomonas sp.]|nr:tripartite tricarboxylate transporter TctB family protein [Marinosulfonomonas sp.]
MDNKRDLVAGILVILVGLFVAVESSTYSLGTAMRMGPGYFPLGLGIILIFLGICILLIDARGPDEGEELKVSWRPMIILPVSVLVFAALIQRFGLGPAIFMAVFVSTFADPKIPMKTALIISTVMMVITILIFIVGLDMQTGAFKW